MNLKNWMCELANPVTNICMNSIIKAPIIYHFHIVAINNTSIKLLYQSTQAAVHRLCHIFIVLSFISFMDGGIASYVCVYKFMGDRNHPNKPVSFITHFNIAWLVSEPTYKASRQYNYWTCSYVAIFTIIDTWEHTNIWLACNYCSYTGIKNHTLKFCTNCDDTGCNFNYYKN